MLIRQMLLTVMVPPVLTILHQADQGLLGMK
jgi:hypothetical protein